MIEHEPMPRSRRRRLNQLRAWHLQAAINLLRVGGTNEHVEQLRAVAERLERDLIGSLPPPGSPEA
jgi:hypothetical protein